ncbi:MAG: BCD family MFS transporter [Anaerolineales bacterium]|nr:BCD family MFS transporter [Anaerolineales bacterium]
MNVRKMLRLGLFQLTAGGLSVLFLGVLNRVMRVELGLELLTVTILVGGGHYLGALIAIPFGYYSDRHPLWGYRRTIYILLGSVTAVSILVGSPWIVQWIAASPGAGRVLIGFLFFLLEGISTYIAGTAYLSLITDLTDKSERGQVTGWVWTLLMVGIIFTGILSGFALEPFSIERVVTLFTVAAVIILVFSITALVSQESRTTVLEAAPGENLSAAFATILRNRQARWFGAFLFLSMFSYFMQDVLLEPFGGEVFSLSPAATTRFNAYMGTGVVAAMLLGGMRLIPSRGKSWTTSLGILLMVISFGSLALSSIMTFPLLLPVLILALGLGAGFFTVGGVSLMMDMTSTHHTGLFVGAWTLIQAFARGPTAIVGGALFTGVVSLGLSAGQAYASVFALEAVGLLVSLVFLRQVAVEEFKRSVESFGKIAAEALQ